MKRIQIFVSLILFVTLFNSCSSIPSGYTQYESENTNLYIKNSEFTNDSYIRHKYFFNTFKETPIDLSITKEPKTKILSARFTYRGNKWIFFENVTIINANGERLEWKFKSYNKDTDVLSGGDVYESASTILTDEEAQNLLNLLSSNNVKLRFSGKYYDQYSLNENYVNALKEILAAYFELDLPSFFESLEKKLR